MTATAADVKVAGYSALYEAGYQWDGRCKCGANDWRDDYWKRGYSVTCRACGAWFCHHEIGGGAHSSTGKWLGSKKPDRTLCDKARRDGEKAEAEA